MRKIMPAKTMSSVVAGLMILINIVSCQRQKSAPLPTYELPPTIEVAPSTTPSTHIPFDYLKALRLMFQFPEMVFSENLGKDTVAINSSRRWSTYTGWRPCESIPGTPSLKERERFECARYLLTESYVQNETIKTLVLTETIIGDCHICAPQISGAVFLQQDGNWILDFKHINFLTIGSWGYAPPAELVQIGDNRFGILFRNRYVSSGITGEETVLFTELNGLFEEIFSFQTALNYQEEGWSYESDLVFSLQSNRDWFDIQITKTDLRETQSGASESFEETVWFTWDGTSYQLRPSN